MSLLLSLSLLTLTRALPHPNNSILQNPSSITKRATAHLFKRYYTYSVLGSVISLVIFVILVPAVFGGGATLQEPSIFGTGSSMLHQLLLW
jgi:hypothetical protein